MRKGQRKEEGKLKTFRFRVTMREAMRILWLAQTYAGGNVSKWLRHSALEAERKQLK